MAMYETQKTLRVTGWPRHNGLLADVTLMGKPVHYWNMGTGDLRMVCGECTRELVKLYHDSKSDEERATYIQYQPVGWGYKARGDAFICEKCGQKMGVHKQDDDYEHYGNLV